MGRACACVLTIFPEADLAVPGTFGDLEANVRESCVWAETRRSDHHKPE